MVIADAAERLTRPRTDYRRTMRYAAAALCAVVAVLYLVLLFLVHDAEASADVVVDTTWGAYLFLAVPYLVGAVLLAVVDQRALWVLGAAVQVVVVSLFVVFGVGVLGPDDAGVFAYEALSDLPMEAFAGVVTVIQLVLLGLLAFLALQHPAAGPASRSPA